MTISNDPREARKMIEASERLDRERLANPPAPHLSAVAHVTKSPTQHEVLGEFEAILATYEVDRDNERFAYGAWSENIENVKSTGLYPPLLFAHDRHDVDAILGKITSMREDPNLGLVITGWIDTSHPMGLKIAEGLVTGRISFMSVGFLSDSWHYEDDGKTRVFDRAEVTEGSFVPTPAQRGARVLNAKSTNEPVHTRKPRSTKPSTDRRHDPKAWQSVIGELADVKSSTELSPDAQALVDADSVARQAERDAAREEFALWVENSRRAAAMRGLTFADEIAMDEKDRQAWLRDHNVREGESVRVPIAPEAPEARTRLTSDEMMPDA